MASNPECPKCNKKTLVQRRDDLYQCVSCDFKRDFTTPNSNPDNSLVWFILLTLTIVSLLLSQDPTPPTYRPQDQPPSANQPTN